MTMRRSVLRSLRHDLMETSREVVILPLRCDSTCRMSCAMFRVKRCDRMMEGPFEPRLVNMAPGGEPPENQ